MVVLALVLGAGLVAGNNITQRRELDQLLARVRTAQDTIAYADRRVAGIVDYTRPLLFGVDVPAKVRAGLQQLVADAAAGQVGAVEQERAGAEGISLLPWHRGLYKAKAALVAYLNGRVQYLRDVAKDIGTLYVLHPELRALLDDARNAMREAAGGGEQARVDAVFAGGTHPA